MKASVLKGKVNFPLCLAPMVGLSHVALRTVAREYLPENAFTLWPTEMLNSRKLPYEDLAKTPETLRHQDETQLVPQILGNEEGPIAASVKVLEDWGAEGIDINMGCPVTKALKHNYGVALMGDADYAKKVVEVTKKNSKLPVSVKLRAADQNDFQYLLNFSKGLVDAGADWIILHPRTAAQKRRGSADWQQIQMLRAALPVPVIGNGDIQTSQDVHKMLQETQCDMAMSGRALAARPWMLWQLGEDLGFSPPPLMKGRLAPRTPADEGREYGVCLQKLLVTSKDYFGENLGLRKFRFHVRHTMGWLLFGQHLFSGVTKAKTCLEVSEFLKSFFDRPQEMLPYTDLRE